MKKGAKVRQILPAPIEGVIVGFDTDQENGDKLIRVEWEDAEGHVCSKVFRDGELVVVEA